MLNPSNPSRALAAVVVAALVAAACGGGETPTVAPAATAAAPAVTQLAEDLETTTTRAPELAVDVSEAEDAEQPDAPESETVAVTEPQQPCPEGEHRHDDEPCHPDETMPADSEATPAEVICGEGLVMMGEFVTDTDNGCRPETCEGDRTEDGQCALVERELTEEEVATLEEATEDDDADPQDDGPTQLTWDEYGLEGCTEVSPGTCDLDGVLYCHDTNTGWAECPGQPSGDPCQHDETDPLSFTGSVQTTGQIPEVTLTAGLYRVDVCLANNDIATGSPDSFLVYFPPTATGGALLTPGDTSMVGGPVVDEQSVVAGTWSREIEILWLADPEPFEIGVTPVGGGTWVLRFVPLS